MTWELKDRIAAAALITSVFALAISGGSAYYSWRQYRLNEDRDQREREATLPVFEQYLETQIPQRRWTLKIEVQNRAETKLFVDIVFTDEKPPGSTLARPAPAGSEPPHLNPTGAMTELFPVGIEARSTQTWNGYLTIGAHEAGGTGKPASLRYEYHFAGEQPRSRQKVVTFRLP